MLIDFVSLLTKYNKFGFYSICSTDFCTRGLRTNLYFSSGLADLYEESSYSEVYLDDPLPETSELSKEGTQPIPESPGPGPVTITNISISSVDLPLSDSASHMMAAMQKSLSGQDYLGRDK